MINKRVLISGGTGSCGIELIKQLINENVREIRVLARNEFLQCKMIEMFKHPAITCIVGDIRDRDCVRRGMQGVDIVFHLAALKHVSICEKQPLEAVRTNILGTSNIVEEAVKAGVEKVVYLSTDKVAKPSSTYGLTKAIGEKIILNANTSSKKTKLSILRSGNILASSGSVVSIFKKNLQRDTVIKLTHAAMTRFFIGLEDCGKRLIEVSRILRGGEVFVMKLPSMRILDIADVLLEYYGKGRDYLEFSSLQEGEKLCEVLVTEEELEYLHDVHENFYMILSPKAKKQYGHIEASKSKKERFSSDERVLKREEVREILQRNKVISF